MRRCRHIAFFAALAILLSLLSACAAVNEQQMNALLETAFSAVQTGDIDALNAIMLPVFRDQPPTNPIQGAVDGPLRDYDLLSRDVSTTHLNQTRYTKTEHIYRAQTLASRYIVYIAYFSNESESGVGGFELVREDEHDPVLIKWGLSRLLSYGFTLLCYGFMLFALIHCLRSRIKWKALFCLMTLVVTSVGFSVLSGSLHLTWFVGFRFIIKLSAVQIFTNGFRVEIALPAGALIYFLFRRHWPQKPPKTPPAEELPPPEWKHAPQPPVWDGTGTPPVTELPPDLRPVPDLPKDAQTAPQNADPNP